MTRQGHQGAWLRSPRVLAQILLLGVVIVWGTTFSLVKSALPDAPPFVFNLLRMTVAFVVLLVFNFRALQQLSAGILGYCAGAGALLGLGYQFQTAGLALTTPSKSAFITGLVVVIVPLMNALPGVRPAGSAAPRWTAYLGALIAFTGLVLLTGRPKPGASAGSAFAHGFGRGEALTLLCACAFAAHLLTLSRVAPLVGARTLGTLQIGFAALLMAFTLPLGGRFFLHVTPRLCLALAVTAVLATAAAFTIQSWAQQHLSSTNTALIFTLEPVFAWLTSLLFLHERMGGREFAGAALILAGLLLAEGTGPLN